MSYLLEELKCRGHQIDGQPNSWNYRSFLETGLSLQPRSTTTSVDKPPGVKDGFGSPTLAPEPNAPVVQGRHYLTK